MKYAAIFLVFILTRPVLAAESLDAAVLQISERIAASRQADAKPLKVAVMGFTLPDKRTTQISLVIMNELAGRLVNAGSEKFLVTERGQLETVLRELVLGEEMIFDQAKVKKIGNLAGAESLVVGEVTPERDRVRMNARLIAVEDSRVLAQASAWFPLTPTIQTHLDKPYIFAPVNLGGESDRLSGTWLGTGKCGKASFGVAIAMVFEPDGKVYGLQSFYPITESTFTPGVLRMNGRFDAFSNKLTLTKREWLYQPPGSVSMPINGVVDVAAGRFDGKYDHKACSTVTLRRR